MLSLFATIINKLQGAMEREVPRIFESVFEVTLTMITKNFEVQVPACPRRLTDASEEAPSSLHHVAPAARRFCARATQCWSCQIAWEFRQS